MSRGNRCAAPARSVISPPRTQEQSVALADPGDTTPQLVAQIARIVIHGTATGSDQSTSDYFGITAEQIGRVVAGVARPFFTTGPDDLLIDSVNADFRAVDFV